MVLEKAYRAIEPSAARAIETLVFADQRRWDAGRSTDRAAVPPQDLGYLTFALSPPYTAGRTRPPTPFARRAWGLQKNICGALAAT
jgi:hypothetical protein